jgi:arylsulfatase A-like enzyme
MIVLDTLRADHLGSYGYPRATSPHIDGLARQGVLFESAISQAPWTAASIASLFTSLYPSVHGLNGGIRWGGKQGKQGNTLPFATQKTLPPGQLTLAEMLRRNGYRTAGFVSNVYVNSIFGFSQGFETYGDDHGDYSGDVGRAKRRASETNRQVFAWLEQEIEEPFFLFVHYNDCHWPYDPPAPFGQEWVKDYQGDLTPERTTAIVEQQGKPITGLDDDDLRYLIGLYDGEVAYTDAAVGDLLEKVRSAGLERELLTVVTADHGEEFLDHGSASHGYTLFDEQIHVPLIFHLPGRLAPRRVAAQVRSIDIMPSILDLAGVGERPDSLQGESLVALLTGKTDRGPSAAYSEATYVGEQKSLRADGKLKLIYRVEDQGTSLFDLASDPRERADVAVERPAVVTSLRGELQSWQQANEELRTTLFAEETEQEVILDDETQERLRALGYIQ